MARARLRKAAVAGMLALAVILTAAWLARDNKAAPAGPVGLFTTLPILWSDSPDLAGCWQARPATAEHLRSTMGAVLVEGVESPV